MKDFINGIIRASGESWFGFIVLCFCAAIAVTLVKSFTADHVVRCYYPQTQQTNAGIAYMIKGDIDWKDDITSYTTPDLDKALEILADLKQCGK
tara:strand:- start:56 stop:337 length:282 start_codon:yes stop_codon:yes gene_type:complete